MHIYDVELKKNENLKCKTAASSVDGFFLYWKIVIWGLVIDERATSLMLSLKKKSLIYRGDFTLLLHSSHLSTELKFFISKLIA